MPLRTTGFLAFAILAGCAAPPQPPARQVAPVQQGQAQAAFSGQSGTILAIHPVPADSPEQVQILLSAAQPRNDLPATPLYELVVRTAGGSTIAIIQPETVDLHPGEEVRILSGTTPRISVPVIH